jgi:hypothetical protein
MTSIHGLELDTQVNGTETGVVFGLLMKKTFFMTTATMLVPTKLVPPSSCLKQVTRKCAKNDMAAHLGLE